MLAELKVKDLALIEELSLSFAPGLNIITGETGAGKSLIMEAVNLLTGGKADTSRVRRGAEAAEVEGLFHHADGSEHVLRRRVGADGKGRSFINGSLATVKELLEVGATLMEFHGQHGHRSILGPGDQLQMVDRFGGASLLSRKKEYRRALSAYGEALVRLEGLREAEADRAGKEDWLAWRIRELEGAGLEIGEDVELEEKIKRLRRQTELFEVAKSAHELIDDQALGPAQSAAAKVIGAAAGDKGLTEVASLLEGAGAGLEEAVRLLRGYAEDLEADAGHLDEYQERLFELNDLKKKYGRTVDGLIAQLDEDRSALAALADFEAAIADLERTAAEARAQVEAAGSELSGLRISAAEQFSVLVTKELKELAFSKVTFMVGIESREFKGGDFGANGLENVGFMFSANPGESSRPLTRVASGGELARLTLAIKTVIGRLDGPQTMVFDEIDSGVGGQAAVKVGERLASLGRAGQVICVTHLPQIAAFADRHFSVVKATKAGTNVTKAGVLTADQRLAEISRLGGALDESEVSVEHARELMVQAEVKKSEAVAK